MPKPDAGRWGMGGFGPRTGCPICDSPLSNYEVVPFSVWIETNKVAISRGELHGKFRPGDSIVLCDMPRRELNGVQGRILPCLQALPSQIAFTTGKSWCMSAMIRHQRRRRIRWLTALVSSVMLSENLADSFVPVSCVLPTCWVDCNHTAVAGCEHCTGTLNYYTRVVYSGNTNFNFRSCGSGEP